MSGILVEQQDPLPGAQEGDLRRQQLETMITEVGTEGRGADGVTGERLRMNNFALMGTGGGRASPASRR